MPQQDQVFSGRLIKRDGKLIYTNPANQKMYELFVKSLEENQSIDLFIEAHNNDGTNLQLAKIHVYLKKISSEVGYTVHTLKKEVKKRSGLMYGNIEKSLADCSKDELGLVLETIHEICIFLKIPYE